MAKKFDKDRFNTAIMNTAKGFGGGVIAEIIADAVNKNAPDWVAENPKLAEAVPAFACLAALYFMDEAQQKQWGPIAIGAAGAAGAGLADDIITMSGFSRNNGRMNGTDEEEFKRGQEFIEKLAKRGFEGTMQGASGGFSMGTGWG